MRERAAEAEPAVRIILDPGAHTLPDDLAGALREVVRAAEEGTDPAAPLAHALVLARAHRYV